MPPPPPTRGMELVAETQKLLDDLDLDDALRVGTTAVATVRAEGDPKHVAEGIRVYVNVLMFREERGEGLKLAQQELAVFKEMGHEWGHAAMLLSIAEIAADRCGMKKRELALKCALEAQDIFERLGDEKMAGTALFVVATVKMLRGVKVHGRKDMKQGVEAAKIALDVFRGLPEQHSMEARCLHLAATCESQLGNLFEAINLSKEALVIWRNLGHRNLEAFELNGMAEWMLEARQPYEALAAATAGMEIFDELANSKSWQGTALGTVVKCLIALRQFQEALDLAQHKLARFREGDDGVNEAAALDCIVAVQLSIGAKKEAVNSAQSVINCIRGLKKSSLPAKKMECHMLHTIASVHLADEEFGKAEKALDESLMAYQGAGQLREQGLVLCTRSKSQLSQHRADDALFTARQALDVFRQAGEQRGEALAWLALTSCHCARGEFSESVSAAMEARTIFADHRMPQAEAETLHMLTQVYMAGGWAGKAVMSAKSALTLLQEYGGGDQLECMISGLVTDAMLLIACEDGPQKPGVELTPAWQKGMQAARDELALARRLGLEDVQHVAKALLNVGRASYMTCQFEAAMAAVTEALHFTQHPSLERARSQVLLLQAQLLCTLGQEDEALGPARKAKELFEKFGDADGEKMVDRILRGEFEPQQTEDQEEKKPRPARKGAGRPSRPVVRHAYEEDRVYQRGGDDDYGSYEETRPAPTPKVEVKEVKAFKGPSLEDLNGKITDVAQSLTGSDEVHGDTPLMDAGLDSLGSVEFQNLLSREFKGVVQLPSTLMFDYPTSKEIASFIHDSMAARRG